jgi:erythrin-vacuolar iron transport family protein
MPTFGPVRQGGMRDAFSRPMSSPLTDFERSDRRVSPRDRRAGADLAITPDDSLESHAHVLRVVQPGLLGLMDGSVSTLAPLFATATLTGRTWSAFLVGLAASIGAGISMGLAEALSDDGQISGRGSPLMRGAITGGGTVIGGMLHTLPFLLTNLRTALLLAYVVVVLELLAIAYIRYRWMRSPLGSTVVQVIIGGGIVFGLGIWLGRLGAG